MSTYSTLSDTSEFKIQVHVHKQSTMKKGRLVNQETAKRGISNWTLINKGKGKLFKQNLANRDLLTCVIEYYPWETTWFWQPVNLNLKTAAFYLFVIIVIIIIIIIIITIITIYIKKNLLLERTSTASSSHCTQTYL